MTITAFNMAEKYRTPVVLLLDEITAHTREKIRIPQPDEYEVVSRIVPSIPPEWYKPYEETVRGVAPMPPIGSGYRFHVTGLTHDENGFPTSRPDEVVDLMERMHRKIDQFFYDIQMHDELMVDDADVVVIAYGCVARSAEYAIEQARASGVKAGLLKLKTLFPYPRRATEKALANARSIIVPEMNMGQMSREVKRVNSGRASVRTINRVDGQIITPSEILKVIMQG
jgi:2-oxoglutarate ferredoxin oxidoreductase subunit alpha